MPALWNAKLEIVAQELAAGKKPEAASRIAGYPTKAKAFAANARKRAVREDVLARIEELRAPGIKAAEESLGITTEYLLAKLDNITNYNIDDYLTAPNKQGTRFLDVSFCPRDLLSRIAELNQEVSGGKRKLLRTKIKGYSVIDGIRLMAQIKGLLKAEKVALTNPDGDGPARVEVTWKEPEAAQA
jgi:hypothetical protein